MSTVRSIKEELMERRLHRMKIVEKYKCDVCGTEYKDRKDATECERKSLSKYTNRTILI